MVLTADKTDTEGPDAHYRYMLAHSSGVVLKKFSRPRTGKGLRIGDTPSKMRSLLGEPRLKRGKYASTISYEYRYGDYKATYTFQRGRLWKIEFLNHFEGGG